MDLLEPRIGYADWMYDDAKMNAKYELVSINYRSQEIKYSRYLRVTDEALLAETS